jgi:Tol biopolymer transport system component
VNLSAGINGPGFDAGASLRRPEFYYTSDGGLDAPLDIYVSRLVGTTFGPGQPVPELSSEGTDLRPSIRFDGLEIFLSSDRAGSTDGSQDIWVSTRQNPGAPWSPPMNLGSAVNSEFFEQQPALSDDGRTLYFASDRPGGSGELDLYFVTRALQASE